MKKFAVLVLVAVAAVMFTGNVASANNGVTGPGQEQLEIILYYTIVETTGSPASDDGVIKNLGGAISGGFYGNTSNSGVDSDAPESGNGVTAPASPGPLVGGCASGPGASLGHAITGNGPTAVPANPDAGPSC